MFDVYADVEEGSVASVCPTPAPPGECLDTDEFPPTHPQPPTLPGKLNRIIDNITVYDNTE